jgi:hypothetical protein
MKQTRHSFLKSQGYTSIKLNKTDTNHYQIEAKINDIEGLFILDTGASNTCADLQINKFHLISIDSEVKASSATDLMSETKVSKKNKLQIGKWISKSSPIVLFDMSHINKALSERDIKAVDGIIGADILKGGKAIIDYEKSKLYLKL